MWFYSRILERPKVYTKCNRGILQERSSHIEMLLLEKKDNSHLGALYEKVEYAVIKWERWMDTEAGETEREDARKCSIMIWKNDMEECTRGRRLYSQTWYQRHVQGRI